MEVIGIPPKLITTNIEKPWKGTGQVNPVSPKKVNPIVPKSPPNDSTPLMEHFARDSPTAKAKKLENLPSSIDIRQLFNSKYQLGSILGRGSSAEVYEARSASSNDNSFPLAAKIIHRDNRMNDNLTMATELEILRRVQHCHVIRLVEVFETVDALYLILERAQGGDLISALAALPEYTESAIRDIFYQLLEAVDYLHSLGVVHRDLKLDNLLFDTNHQNSISSALSNDETDDDSVASKSLNSAPHLSAGNIVVKVADFGLSALLADETPSKLQLLLSNSSQLAKCDSRLSDMWGTTEYFAPEVYERRYGRQADVWALGCILFEMLTGELAFPYRETPIGIVERVLFHGGSKPLRVFERKKGWSKLSPNAQSLIKKMLKPSPSKRLSIAECLKHPWFASSSIARPQQIKHVSSADSVQSCATCSSTISLVEESLVEAQQVLKDRVARRERRYQNLVLEIAARKSERK